MISSFSSRCWWWFLVPPFMMHLTDLLRTLQQFLPQLCSSPPRKTEKCTPKMGSWIGTSYYHKRGGHWNPGRGATSTKHPPRHTMNIYNLTDILVCTKFFSWDLRQQKIGLDSWCPQSSNNSTRHSGGGKRVPSWVGWPGDWHLKVCIYNIYTDICSIYVYIWHIWG